MTLAPSTAGSDPASARDARLRGFGLWWNLGWVGAVALGALLLALFGLLDSGLAVIGLLIGAAPALIGVGLSRLAGGRTPTLIVVNWAVAGAMASAITGGAGGPLGVWCLGPLAAAIVLGQPRLAPLAAALSLAAVAASATAAAVLRVSPPDAAATMALGLMSLGVMISGLAVALVMSQSVEGLKQSLAGQPQLLVALDAQGWVTGLAGQAPGGIEARRLHGRSILGAAASDSWNALEAALRQAASAGWSETGFVPAGDPDGWAILSLRRLDSRRFVGAVRDGRAQRAYEAELERARETAEAQNAGKSRFLANMSHELRTPLNAIMGFSDIMRQRLFGPMSERYGEYSELIHESGSHLLELINDVLDMSKIEAERYELMRDDFDAREAVSAVLRLMRGQADRAGVSLRGVLPKDALEAHADRRAIKQIVLNLISNALKFTLRGGSVTVTAQAVGEMLEITVADTGVGISPEDLARLGRPYEQAGGVDQRAAGTGLGLSLVRAFAELHGGQMTIESVVGEGTSVTVRLPVMAGAPRPAPIPELAE